MPELKIFRVAIYCLVDAESEEVLQERIDTLTPGEILEKGTDIYVGIQHDRAEVKL